MHKINLKDKIIYQIFPRSFYDSNNDGDGDIVGIIKKLDYIKELGVNAIWLCPIYDTEFIDAGYDVLNYKSVWKQFGTIEEFKTLSQEAKKRNIDLIVDIVLNHVSNKHKWFQKACESVENVEHNYFIWRDKLSEEEQKATSIFGGSAWEYVKSVNKYYFHLFTKEQVDLNWENENTIKAMADVIDFWYKLGVKGFRLDAIKHISKDFKTTETNPYFAWCDGAVDFLKNFNELAFEDKEDAYTIGESSGINPTELIKYSQGEDKVADNYYNFSWWWIGWSKQTGRNGYDPNWNFREFVWQQKSFQENKKLLPQSFTNFLSNHDTSRSISRWGSETFYWKESAKAHALMLFSLKGIPCIYYGEEIGLVNNRFSSRDEFKDCDITNAFTSLVDEQKIYSESEFINYCNINSRDAGRVIMRWESEVENMGFNKGYKPWIKLDNFRDDISVKNQIQDKNSILSFYKKIIELRTQTFRNILVDGDSFINIIDDEVIEIRREFQDQKLIIYINMQQKNINVNPKKGELILSSYDDKKTVKNLLRPYEAILIKL